MTGRAGGDPGSRVLASFLQEADMRRHDHKLEMLRRLPLFDSCDDRELESISRLVDETTLPAGRVLITEGSAECREAFIILDGSAEVTVRGVRVAVLGPGDCTGEMGVIDHDRRSATVTASTDLR